MKLTNLTIEPQHTWKVYDPETNPMVGSMKLQTEETTVQTTLSPEAVKRMIALCCEEIANAAKANADAFALAAKQHGVLEQEALEPPSKTPPTPPDIDDEIPF